MNLMDMYELVERRDEWKYLKELTEEQNVLLDTKECEEVISYLNYLLFLGIKELKHKKEIPTVIEYQGRRYVLDHGNHK